VIDSVARRTWHHRAARCAIGAVFLLAAVPAAVAGNAAYLSGWLLGRAGYGLDSGNHRLTLDQQLLQLEWKPPAVQDWHLDASIWAEHETSLEPSTTAGLTLRELTLRKETATYALTLGRQIVVWGKADGFRLLDIVNPLDLREFVLGDDVRRRMPLWMANLQFFPNDNQQVQLLLIPQTYHDRLPDPGGEFDLRAFLPPGVKVLPLQEPSNGPENWSYGLRWSTTWGDWDISLIGLRNLTGAPAAFPSLTSGGRLQLRPEVVRRTVLGTAADWNAGPAVVRLELAVSPDEYRVFTSAGGIPYLKQKTTLRTLLGIDWYVGNWLISPQIFDVEADGDPGVVGDPDGRFGSLLLEHKFYYDKLTVRMFAASSLTRTDYWVDLTLRYQLLDHLELSVTGDWLGGGSDAFFGRFADRDRIVAEAKAFF
jgi:hypothetical protein